MDELRVSERALRMSGPSDIPVRMYGFSPEGERIVTDGVGRPEISAAAGRVVCKFRDAPAGRWIGISGLFCGSRFAIPVDPVSLCGFEDETWTISSTVPLSMDFEQTFDTSGWKL